MTPNVSYIAAFLAGVLSISSPCVLPLLPIFLARLAGVSVGSDGAAARSRLLVNAVAYVLGFSLVFISLGLALGAAGVLVDAGELVTGNRVWLMRIGGVLLVVLGLHQLGIVRLPFLQYDHRISTDELPRGQVTSSFLIGVTFGAGWSPCVGPILGAILTLAAGQGSVSHAGLLLATYSAGLAVPFLAAAVAWGSSPGFIKRMNRHLGTVTMLSGGLMVGLGVILFLGWYQQFFARLVAMSPWTPWEPTL